MEFMPGGDLNFYINGKGKFSEIQVKYILAQILLAIEFLHNNGIIHRDIKPENIYTDRNGYVKLGDFGMCMWGIEGMNSTNTFCGTPHYMAPEIIKRQNYNKMVDYWSLGVLLFELITGNVPFHGDTKEHIFNQILYNNPSYPGYLSKHIHTLISNFLNRDSKKRLGNNITDVKNHPYFSNILWNDIETKNFDPNFTIYTDNQLPLYNFSYNYTKIPHNLTESKNKQLLENYDNKQDAENPFDSFSFDNFTI